MRMEGRAIKSPNDTSKGCWGNFKLSLSIIQVAVSASVEQSDEPRLSALYAKIELGWIVYYYVV